jgi:hypothetical protein
MRITYSRVKNATGFRSNPVLRACSKEEKDFFESQNIKQGMSNVEVFGVVVLTSAIRYPVFDI